VNCTLAEGVTIDLFDGLADDVARRLIGEAQVRRAMADAVLFSEGAAAGAAHVLTSGFVKLVRTTPNGARVILRYIKPGETFGMPALAGAGCYTADAIAVTNCTELQWPLSTMRELLLRRPRAALNAIRDLETRLRHMELRLIDLSNEPVEQRLAHALVRLVEKFGVPLSDGTAIPFPLSRQDLADMTGSTLYTVSRTLSAWEAQGQIRRGRRHVTVTNLAGLNRLSGNAAASRPPAAPAGAPRRGAEERH
jgi:CRP-like cAMP-binding protein